MLGSNVCELPASAADDIRNLSLEHLCAEIRAQEANFVNGQPSDDAAGLELFRRAIDTGDEQAWTTVVGLYRHVLIAQTRRWVIRTLIEEDDGFCVDRAFQRFWRATRINGLREFHDLGSIRKYLTMCLGSVLLDEARNRKRKACIPLDQVPPAAQLSADPATLVAGRIARHELWQTIDDELQDDVERLVARLSFAGGLTPREILARHGDRFEGVAEIYRLKHRIIERLRRSRALERHLR